MNECLLNFKNERKFGILMDGIMILGFHKKEKHFFWRGMSCWGWATWDDRWKYYKKILQLLLRSGIKIRSMVLIMMEPITFGHKF